MLEKNGIVINTGPSEAALGSLLFLRCGSDLEEQVKWEGPESISSGESEDSHPVGLWSEDSD